MTKNQLDDLLEAARHSGTVTVDSDWVRALVGAIRARNLEAEALRRHVFKLPVPAQSPAAGATKKGESTIYQRLTWRGFPITAHYLAAVLTWEIYADKEKLEAEIARIEAAFPFTPEFRDKNATDQTRQN